MSDPKLHGEIISMSNGIVILTESVIYTLTIYTNNAFACVIFAKMPRGD